MKGEGGRLINASAYLSSLQSGVIHNPVVNINSLSWCLLAVTLTRRRGRATTERRLKANLGSRQGRNGGGRGSRPGSQSRTERKEREENHTGKTWWGGEKGGRQSWNVRPGTSRTHPEKAQMAALKKKKKNHELHGLIPTADLAAVCGTVYTMSGVGGRLPPPLQCCASCTPAASSADP